MDGGREKFAVLPLSMPEGGIKKGTGRKTNMKIILSPLSLLLMVATAAATEPPKNIVLILADDQHIPIFTFHGVPDAEHGWVSTSPELFEKFMQYLKNNDFKAIALRDYPAKK